VIGARNTHPTPWAGHRPAPRRRQHSPANCQPDRSPTGAASSPQSSIPYPLPTP